MFHFVAVHLIFIELPFLIFLMRRRLRRLMEIHDLTHCLWPPYSLYHVTKIRFFYWLIHLKISALGSKRPHFTTRKQPVESDRTFPRG